jgi:hypothetical protein
MLAPGSSHEGFGRVDSTPVSQLKPRGEAQEPEQPPLILFILEVGNHAKGGSVFRCGCQGNPSSCCGPCHGTFLEKSKAPTNMQPCLQAGIKSKFFSEMVRRVYIVRARLAL